nr:unnamed protein product [Callosobruchus analis]
MSFEEIITEIQIKPELWMSSHPLFKNRIIKSKSWKELAEKLHIEEEVLKKRWKHLKDQFRKELKKQPVLRSGAEADVWVSTWQYYDLMTFLKDEVLPAPTTGNLQELEESQVTQDTDETPEIYDMDSDSNISLTSPRPQSSRSSSRQSSTTPSISLPKKRGSTKEDYLEIEQTKLSLMEKRIEIQNNSNLDKDDDMLYFQSLLPSMKKLTHIQKLKLRGKINDWWWKPSHKTSKTNSKPKIFNRLRDKYSVLLGTARDRYLVPLGITRDQYPAPMCTTRDQYPAPVGTARDHLYPDSMESTNKDTRLSFHFS